MKKYFNSVGACNPDEHYMVYLDERIKKIKALVDQKKYFTINRARQYGKTTTLDCLAENLKATYAVFYISFEGLADESYKNETIFCRTFCGLLYDTIQYGHVEGLTDSSKVLLQETSQAKCTFTFRNLSNLISEICGTAQRPLVLMIDEVDQAGAYPVFLSFLGMLRSQYLKRMQRPVFQSVILASVYDIKNLKLKIRPKDTVEKNSPWNIAADFDIHMSFSSNEIFHMLETYEDDYHTGMDIQTLAGLLYDYTSGYPFLVSRLCQLVDEKVAGTEHFPDKIAAWTKDGFLEAVKMILSEKNTLFESLINKLNEYPKLKKMLYSILFTGDQISFNYDNPVIDLAFMLGFVTNQEGMLRVANRIFETRLYNLFLSEEEVGNHIYSAGMINKNQFIHNGFLDMDMVLTKFMHCWNDLYSTAGEKFIEDNGRKFFLLFLKPIINGAGNYYIESTTRDNRRTDVIVDYLGRQYIIEIKIWRGNEYHKQGEQQLIEYLDAYHSQKGYLLSFNFNKKKSSSAKELNINGKTIFEVIV